MTRTSRILFGLALLGSTIPGAAAAQTAPPASLMGDLVKATTDVETKILALAGAFSAAQYDWRPGDGVRSVREVLLHVAADNYFLPAPLGVPAPAATRIVATDFAAVQAFEKQNLDRDATIAALTASFAHLKHALAQIPETRMNERVSLFGQEFTVRGLLVLTTTHLHEHLGQLIAYARTNGVAPPWSR